MSGRQPDDQREDEEGDDEEEDWLERQMDELHASGMPFGAAPFTLVGVDNIAGHSYLAIDVNPSLSLEDLENMIRVAIRGYLRRVGEGGGSPVMAVGQVKRWAEEVLESLLRR